MAIRSPRFSSALSRAMRLVSQSLQPSETSWLQETQDMYRANAKNAENAESANQDSEEMLALLLNAMFICGISMLMYALFA